MKRLILGSIYCVFAAGLANAQTGNVATITAAAAGKVRVGMTVAEVRKAVAPMKLERSSDGEGVALIAVKNGNDQLMSLYAGEEDRDSRINEKAKIEGISVYSRDFKTKEGVHVGMALADAEKIYGKVKQITMSEIESREFAQFSNHPEGLQFRVMGKDGTAGVYPPNSSNAASYTPGTRIFSVEVTGAFAERMAVAQIPSGDQLVHPIVSGEFGAAQNGYVVLYGNPDPALKYSGMVVVSRGTEAEKYTLPTPDLSWSIEDPKAAFFANADDDPELELFIIAECYTGIGPTGAQPFFRTRVYDWKGDRFVHLDPISEEVGNLRTAAAIRKQLPAIVKRAEARYQPMDVDALNEKLSANKSAKTPLQAIDMLVDPFDEMLSRSISITADSIENAESLAVTVTDDGYADDSVRGAQFKFRLTKNVDGVWQVSTASKGWRCQAGRGSQTFSSKPCS